MPPNEWYRQCRVWRPAPNGKGIEETTVFLQDSGDLYVGARVRFKEAEDEASEGWRVASMGYRMAGRPSD